MPSKEIKELRQTGKLEEALEMAQSELNADIDNIWGKRNISWVYYEYLKKYAHEHNFEGCLENLTKIKELGLPEDETMLFDTCAYQIGSIVFSLQNSEPIEYYKINLIFDIVKDFQFTKPSESYSFIYKAFHKGYKNWSKYLEFADWWNFENFRTEDFLEEEYNERKIMAIVEQAHIAYSKKILEGEESEQNPFERIINKDKINDFLPKLSNLIESHPDYQYPPYFKAKLLLAIGDEKEVLSAFLPFANQKCNDFWVWELMSDVFHDDDDRKLACLCKALSLRSKEDFVINTRQKMTSILVCNELYSEAKTEIKKILNTRESHEWKIPYQVNEWTQQPWYNSVEAKNNNKDYYKLHVATAEEILFEDVPEVLIAVEFVNRDKKMLNFIKDKSLHGFFNYKNSAINPDMGDVLKVRLESIGNDGFHKVLTVKKQDDDTQLESEAIKQVSAEIRIPMGKNFGFLEDVFVPQDIIDNHNVKDGDELSCKAILSFNKKKSEWGWKCLKLITC